MLENKGRQKITIKTLHGKVTFNRTVLRPADSVSQANLRKMGKSNVYPVDEAMGIDRFTFKTTANALSAIAREAVLGHSYINGQKNTFEKYFYRISISEIEEITDFVGNLVFNEITEVAKREVKTPFDNRRRRRRADDIGYLMADGAMIHVRDKGRDDINGDKGKSAWVESKHAIFFSGKDLIPHGTDNDGKPRYSIRAKKGVGFIGPAEDFEKYLLWLARHSGFEQYSIQVIVIDGCIWLLHMMERLFPHAQIILDKYHAKENAGKFAKAVVTGEPEQKAFADHLCSLIDNGDVETLLDILAPYEGVKLPDGCVNMYTYVKNHRKYMDYPRYEELGYCVGSGAMESSNKSLMQNRMKLAGMLWCIERACHFLMLKILLECDEWHLVTSILQRYAFSLR